MSKIIVIPALGTILALLGIIVGIMIHRHDSRVFERQQYREEQAQTLAIDKQAMSLDCKKLIGQGLSVSGCK